jgi:hypothetical protein
LIANISTASSRTHINRFKALPWGQISNVKVESKEIMMLKEGKKSASSMQVVVKEVVEVVIMGQFVIVKTPEAILIV